MIKIVKVGISQGDIEVLEKTLSFMYDYELDKYNEERSTMRSLKNIINDFKLELED